MPDEPAVRTSAARDAVQFTDVFRPGSLAEIRATVPAASLAQIDSQLGTSWLPTEHDRWLVQGTLQVLGVADAIECWRRSITSLVEKPLFRSLVSGSLRLFGNDPAKILSMIPKGWELAYRGCCSPRILDRGEQHLDLGFERIHPAVLAVDAYPHSWHGLCQGLFELAKPNQPELSFELDRARSVAIARFRWQ